MYILVFKKRTNGAPEFDWQIGESIDQINEILEDFGDSIAYYSIYKGKLIESTL